MGMPKKKSKITLWKPKENDIIVTSDGKLFIFFFEKLFDADVKIYDRFFIKKKSYEKQLEVICKYINFFIKFYDKENELAMAYLKIKYALDLEKRFDSSNIPQLIDLIYEVMFSDTMINKIKCMVNDNYTSDIESSDVCKKYSGKEKKHLESLEFTNQHVKILLAISFGMKCIAPIMFHFMTINLIKMEKDSDLIYNFYKKLFTIFNDDVNIYNKLFVYVKAKVLESKSHNSVIFEQRDILGNDEYLVIHQFIKKVLISDNMVKYVFDDNIIGFNKTLIKFQLQYFLKGQYAKNLTEVTSVKNSEGLSGMDKMEMNLQKIDEGLTIFADMNIKTELKRIIRDNDFTITDEEINYYVNNHHPSPLQIQLVYSYWSKYFGSYRNTNLINRREYITLLLILKKQLLLQAGCSQNNEFSEFSKLPYLLTGNLQDKVNTRIIRNNKFTSKVNESYLYDKLKNNKYSALCTIQPDYIISLLSKFINTTFTYVVYENPELLGKEIEYNEDKISDELLFFLNSI